MSDSCILDWTGRPAQRSRGLYSTPSNNPAAWSTKPDIRQRTYENVTAWQRRDLINWSWGIYAKIPNIRAALKFKTNFACSDGCFVQYQGTNKPWGRRAEAFLNETYYANCNLAGENHDFHATLAEVSIALETHGQVGWVFDSETGKVKLISANSIGNGMSPDSKSGAVYELGKADKNLGYWGLSNCVGGYDNLLEIERGPFAGNFLIDGIIVDRRMVTQGYRLIGFDAAGKASYADLPVSQMGLIYEPEYTDQIMGYPGLSPIIESVGTVDDWKYYIGQAIKLSASMAVTRKSKDGRPATSGVTYTKIEGTDTEGKTQTRVEARQIVQAGLVELATENDEEIGSVPFARPSMNEDVFIKLLETGFFAEHWPREFIHTEGFGRAASRIGVVQARQIVWKRHRTLARFGVKWLRLKIADAMKRGEIPENNALFDPYDITLSTPAEITCDEGNDAKIDLAKLGRGVSSHRIIAAKDGHNDERIEDDNFEKRNRLMKKAIALSAKQLDPDTGKPIWTPKEILQMMDNLGNANQPIDLSSPEETPPPPPANNRAPAPAGHPRTNGHAQIQEARLKL